MIMTRSYNGLKQTTIDKIKVYYCLFVSIKIYILNLSIISARSISRFGVLL